MITRYSSSKWLRLLLLGVALICTINTSQLFADDPKPDPAGTATGGIADAQSASGSFVVAAPAELSADDKKYADKVKA